MTRTDDIDEIAGFLDAHCTGHPDCDAPHMALARLASRVAGEPAARTDDDADAERQIIAEVVQMLREQHRHVAARVVLAVANHAFAVAGEPAARTDVEALLNELESLIESRVNEGRPKERVRYGQLITETRAEIIAALATRPSGAGAEAIVVTDAMVDAVGRRRYGHWWNVADDHRLKEARASSIRDELEVALAAGTGR